MNNSDIDAALVAGQGATVSNDLLVGLSSGSKLNIKGLCLDFAALGQRCQSLDVLSPDLGSAMSMESMDVDSDCEQPQTGDPTHYTINYVPLPQIVPSDQASDISKVSKFRTSFACPPEEVMGQRVLPSGISMMKCLEGKSNLIDGDEQLHSGWAEHDGKINVVISWPGYVAHNVANISVYDETTKQLITRSQLAKLISMHYFLFFDFLTLHEHNAENGEPYEEKAISQDHLRRIGLRGYMFDRLQIMSVTQMFDNFCKIEVSVMTAKGFPESVQYP